MSKQYTPDEMREIADEIGNVHDEMHEKAADILYWLADKIEEEDEENG